MSFYGQISKSFDEILSKCQYDFRKGFNSRICLAYMVENWREAIDSGVALGTFNWFLKSLCLLHDLVITKFYAYSTWSQFIHSYLNDRKQKVTINNQHSSFEEILFGVPQVSILRPLLFNIFISDLFLIIKDLEKLPRISCIGLVIIEWKVHSSNTPHSLKRRGGIEFGNKGGDEIFFSRKGAVALKGGLFRKEGILCFDMKYS